MSLINTKTQRHKGTKEKSPFSFLFSLCPCPSFLCVFEPLCLSGERK